MFKQMFSAKSEAAKPQASTLDQLFYQAVQQQEPMIVFTPQGEIVDANALFLSAVGYAKSEILGQHHRMFCAADYARGSDYQRFWQALARGEAQAGTFSRYKKTGTSLNWKRIIFR